jgi:hypothetical protein
MPGWNIADVFEVVAAAVPGSTPAGGTSRPRRSCTARAA